MIRVTVTDMESGEAETQVIANDYAIVCAGSCHVAGLLTHRNGTHVLTVKGRDVPARKPRAAESPTPTNDKGGERDAD